MNNKMKILFLLMALSPLLTNCVATDKDMQSVSLRVRSVDSKVLDIDREIATLKKETFEQVRMLQAKESARIDELQSEILILKGLLEEITRENNSIRNDIDTSNNALRKSIHTLGVQIAEKVSVLEQRLAQMDRDNIQRNQDIASLNQDIASLQEQVAKADTGINEIKRARALEAVERARQAAAAVAEAKTLKKLAEGNFMIKTVKRKSYPGQEDPTVQADKKTVSTGTLYERGIRSYNAGNYSEAARLFASYISEHPNGKYLPDAYFMRGECFYSQKEYESAILEYQTVIEDYFDHPRAPAALLKQGLSFEKINDTNAAKILYQQIVENYPDSEQIPGARKRLQAIQ
jgi:tol-pal system protein YbgF